MTEKIVIPSSFKLGLQNRHDTFSGKLGYMIYANKPDGSYGQQKSFDGWVSKDLPIEEVKNHYQHGFVLNKGHLNHYRFGASAKFRVFHPHGFEFEITLENLSLILAYTTVSSGEINVPCCIGWHGKNCYLMPEVDLSKELLVENVDVERKQKEAQIKSEKRKNSGKPIPDRSITNNRIFEDGNGNRYFVSAPNYTNQDKVMLKPFFVNEFSKKATENGFMDLKGENYHFHEPQINFRYIYPLTEVGALVTQDTLQNFYAMVNIEDLTADEMKNLEKLKKTQHFHYTKDFNFKAFEWNKENFNSTIEKMMDKSYFRRKNKQSHYADAAFCITESVVNIGGVAYAMLVADKVYFPTMFNHEYPTNIGPDKKRTDMYRSFLSILFMPIASLSKVGYINKTQKVNSMDIFTDEKGNLKMDDCFDVISKMITQVTQDELEVVNKQLLRIV